MLAYARACLCSRAAPACPPRAALAGITGVPRTIHALQQLEGLQAEGCPLAQPFAALYAKEPLLLVQLHDTSRDTLDLSDAGLTEVPAQVLALTGLTALDLSKNAIKVRTGMHRIHPC